MESVISQVLLRWVGVVPVCWNLAGYMDEGHSYRPNSQKQVLPLPLSPPKMSRSRSGEEGGASSHNGSQVPVVFSDASYSDLGRFQVLGWHEVCHSNVCCEVK